MEIHHQHYVISDDKSRIDKELVLGFLSRSYWANKRPHERTVKAIETSYCLGVYDGDRQVGFARVVSDYATIYYICDVFVQEEHRGRGIGKRLVETIVSADMFQGMTGLLGTFDAHGLYEQYGFVREPDRYLKRLPQARP
ncbi:GNAT family N-acetyltransferase [Paenibacillus cymbidii]|uniref:GNAT family N-acetyltransferase n=1 Tax=Paenibacillus cymbidii TaxID=1639034 RepID=UPI001081E901|nr:GNAT family N-acetyltransferase [Paenibacillus cymbidii]